jgi:hypothetical protein
MEEEAMEARSTISKLQHELADTQCELAELSFFRGLRPEMEAEIAQLKAQIATEHEERRLRDHQLQCPDKPAFPGMFDRVAKEGGSKAGSIDVRGKAAEDGRRRRPAGVARVLRHKGPRRPRCSGA